MKICVSGLTGSGKSTLSRRLAEHYGIPLLSGGDMPIGQERSEPLTVQIMS